MELAYVGGKGLQVVSINPSRYATNVPVSASINIVLSTDIINVDEASLASAVKIRQANSGVDVPGEFSYKSRTITFIPSNHLSPGESYTVTVIANTLTALDGSTMASNYISTFATSSSETPAIPTLLSPANYSMLGDIELKWLSESDLHTIQVSKSNSFSTIVIESVAFSGNTFVPTELEPNQQYYWRVKGVSSDGSSGAWSETWTFYREDKTDEAGDQDEDTTEHFKVESISPESQSSFVPVTLKNIVINYTKSLSEESLADDQIKIIAKPIDDEYLEDVPYYTDFTVEVEGKSVKIALNQDLEPTTEYRVHVGKNLIASVDGETISEDISWHFTTPLLPHYTTVELVRMDIGEFIQDVSDDYIHRVIHDVSKWADFIAERPVSENNISYYRCYVRYETDMRLLNTQILKQAVQSGEEVKLGDFQIAKKQVNPASITMATKSIKDNLDKCEKSLRGSKGKARPRVATKSETGYPYPLTQRRF